MWYVGTVPKKPPAREKRLRRRKRPGCRRGTPPKLGPKPTLSILPSMRDPGARFRVPPITDTSSRTIASGPRLSEPPTTVTLRVNFAVDIGRTADGDHVAGDDFVARHGDIAADANEIAAAGPRRSERIRLIAILLPVRLGGGGVHASQVALRGRVQVKWLGK